MRFATDHHLKQEVALKFMRFKDHFERELACRRLLSEPAGHDPHHTAASPAEPPTHGVDTPVAGTRAADDTDTPPGESDRYILSILRAHDSDADAQFHQEITAKGFAEYPYCCVMPMADRSLADVMTHENIAGRDWKQIRLVLESCTEFLVQLHERGFIHGDMKPENIVRAEGRWKGIDLDASVSFAQGHFAGVKVSAAYAPPEMVQLSVRELQAVAARGLSHAMGIGGGATDTDAGPPGHRRRAFVRKVSPSDADGEATTAADDEGQKGSDEPVVPLPAAPSYDLWSLGAIFFELCTGEPLFLSDAEGAIDEDDLLSLHSWSAALKVRPPYLPPYLIPI